MRESNLAIKHDLEHKMFFLKLQHAPAYLKYEKHSDSTLNLNDMHVPDTKGATLIGDALIDYVLQHAKDKGYDIIAGCTAVEDFINHHQEYKELIHDPK